MRGLGAWPITHHYKRKLITETQTIDISTLRTHSRGSRPPGGMMPHSQIRSDARRRNILSTRGPTRIATWNVRTMYKQGRCANISKEMKEYNIDILELCETKWVQAGQTEIEHRRDYHLPRTPSHEDSNAQHTQGVAVMMSKKLQSCL